MNSADELPLVILVGSGFRPYRRYLLELAAAHARVWLFSSWDVEWELPHIFGHHQLDTGDRAAMIAAANEVASKHKISGVLCWCEELIVPTAELAAALNLPGGTPEAYSQCRDKHLTRLALAAAGTPSAASVLVATTEQAQVAAQQIGYPVIVKPRALAGSVGVVKVESAVQLDAAFAVACTAQIDGYPRYDAGVLVEEYLDGPEISIDSACVKGEATALFIARKHIGYPPYFEEVGHTVDAQDPLLSDPAVCDLVTSAHTALGIQDGTTHIEVRLTPSGPRVVEINGRMGGDLIPLVGKFATGIDLGRVAIDIACGATPDLQSKFQQVAEIRFLYPDRDMTVEAIALDRDLLPPGIVYADLVASRGRRLELPPKGHVSSRYAYLVSVGEDSGECEETLSAGTNAVIIEARYHSNLKGGVACRIPGLDPEPSLIRE